LFQPILLWLGSCRYPCGNEAVSWAAKVGSAAKNQFPLEADAVEKLEN